MVRSPLPSKRGIRNRIIWITAIRKHPLGREITGASGYRHDSLTLNPGHTAASHSDVPFTVTLMGCPLPAVAICMYLTGSAAIAAKLANRREAQNLIEAALRYRIRSARTLRLCPPRYPSPGAETVPSL